MIVVIGGGISGLAVAYHLQRAGADFIVLEARDGAGGVIGSVEVEGRVLELGPQRTRLTEPLRRLVTDLDLGDRLITAPDLPLFIYRDRRLRKVPLDLRTAATTDLIGWRDRARALLEPFTGPVRLDETAEEYFARKFGRGAYERLIAPLYGGLYASDPADMRARHALLPVLRALGVRKSVLAALTRGAAARSRVPTCSFRGGLGELTGALARALGDRLVAGTPVQRVDHRGDQLHVVHEHGEIRADRVVLACPADVAGRLLEGTDPDGGRRMRALRYHRLTVVHLLANTDLHGHGYQVALDEGLATHGVAWNDAMFGRRRLYTAFLGGARRPAVQSLPDEDRAEIAAREFRKVTGAEARPIHVHRTRMPAWDTSWDRLDDLILDPRLDVCANWWGRPGITGRLLEADRLAARLVADRPTARPLVPSARQGALEGRTVRSAAAPR